MKKSLKSISLALVSAFSVSTFYSCSSDNNVNTNQPADLVQSLSADKGFLATRNFEETGYTIVKVFYTNKKQLTTLNDLGMDVWTVQDKFAVGQVPEGLLDRIKKTNLKVEMLSPKEGFSVQNTFDPQYHTYDELTAELNEIAAKYPNLAKLGNVGKSWESAKGKADRKLWSMRITGKGNPDSKPGIVFFGNHHARELVTVEIPLMLIKHLLENYGKDADITNMLDSTDIWVIPMVNPDGHTLAEKGNNWRKNKNDNKDVSATASMGVDLNRNYGHQWNTGGSSDDTRSETYHGKAAFSEPETQAIRDFMTKQTNLKIMMSYHSFSNLILWPWGWSNSPTPDAAKFNTIGKKLGANAGYKPEQSSELYIASGITDDYAYAKLKMLSFTTEMGAWGDGFDPPYSKVAQFWKENLPNALYLIKLASDSNASFGPDVEKVTLSGGKYNVSFDAKYPNEVSKIEYFTGKPGKAGTGTAVEVNRQKSVSFSVDKAAGNMVYVRAQGPDGKWGPVSTAFVK